MAHEPALMETSVMEKTISATADGGVASSERQVGKPITQEVIGSGAAFALSPSDTVAAVVGGGYTSNWQPDFLTCMGADGVCDRFFFDKKIAVDIIDPRSELASKKRKLLHENGFGYMAIHPGSKDMRDLIQKKYRRAVERYNAYAEENPRPEVLQDVTIVDNDGKVRLAKVPALDTKVGGGISGSIAQQASAVAAAPLASKKESRLLKLHRQARERLKACKASGKPFRNPFVTATTREYRVS
jgi:hypothetical protein